MQEEQKIKNESGLAEKWIKEIEAVESSRAERELRDNGERIVKKYKNASALDSRQKSYKVGYNILNSNVQILKPAIFARMPKIVVERRFKDVDLVGNLASRLVERSTSFMLATQHDRYMYANSSAVEDMLLVGRGQVWLRYSAGFEEQKDENGELILDEEGNPVKVLIPNSEKVFIDPLCWSDYLESLSRNQYEVRWRARKLYWTRERLKIELGEELGCKIPLDYDPSNQKSSDDDDNEFKQATIYLVADNESKRFLWIHKQYKDAPLRVVSDPFKLDDFFPCPRPLLTTHTSESSYPTPDYIIYEQLAEELDFTVNRLSSMTNCIRMVGAIASQYNKDVKNILKNTDGTLLPIDNWQMFSEKGGFSGVIDWIPFDQCVAAIPVLSQRVIEIKGWIDEITGIPDILRGVSDPSETLGAQQMKGRSLAVKLENRRAEVQRFNREQISKIAQIIFEAGLFSDETISLMAGVPQMSPEDQALFPEALALLRDDRLRTFRIDIETDSTIALDESEDQDSRMQYLQAISQLVSNLEQVSAFRPELIQPMIESALHATRAFRTGRQLEGAWTKALDDIIENDKSAQEAAANQPPPPDYEMMKAQNEQAKTEVEVVKSQVLQGELQLKQFAQQFEQYRDQAKLDLESQKLMLDGQKLQQDGLKLQLDSEIKTQQLQIDASVANAKIDVDAMATQLEMFTASFEQRVAQQKLELDKVLGQLSIQEKLMEEKRLAHDSQIAISKTLIEAEKNKIGLEKNQIELQKIIYDTEKKKDNEKKETEKSQKPKKRVHKIIKTAEGFVGESIDE